MFISNLQENMWDNNQIMRKIKIAHFLGYIKNLKNFLIYYSYGSRRNQKLYYDNHIETTWSN
jgi:hypothetical protein